MRKTPTQIALDALSVAEEARTLILKHESECNERWKEATVELRGLRSQLDLHAKRWEKIAWILSTAVVGAATITIISNF